MHRNECHRGFAHESGEKPMRKYRNLTLPPALLDKEARQKALDEAFQEAARKGLIVDSGERRWSERTGRYEIVWKSKIYERPN
jgi:hypothetical protein